jgi:hypothetical protein
MVGDSNVHITIYRRDRAAEKRAALEAEEAAKKAKAKSSAKPRKNRKTKK